MASFARRTLERAVWKYKHPDYKSQPGQGERTILMQRTGVGTCAVELTKLTDAELLDQLPAPVKAILGGKSTDAQKKQALNFYDWKCKASRWAQNLVGVNGLWDADDPYDLAIVAAEAFASGTTPRAFIEDAFAEDIAREQHDRRQATEALSCDDEGSEDE